MNTNERARLRTKERSIAAIGQQAYNLVIDNMRREVMEQKESVLQAFIAEETGSDLFNPADITKRGEIHSFPDGVEEFWWDNHPRLRFLPVDMVNDKGKMRLVQQYERIPVPAEPAAEESAS